MAGMNLNKVQFTPIKTVSNKLPAASVTKVIPVTAANVTGGPFPPNAAVQLSTTILEQVTTTDGDEMGDNLHSTPGYLQSNFASDQKKQKDPGAKDKKTKKKHWVPSSQFNGPPINKIPKETLKALE